MLPKKNPQLKKAVGKLMELTADERERMLADAREKSRRDLAAIEKTRERKGFEKGQSEALHAVARKMLSHGRPLEEIMEDTGLSIDEIRALMH
jgi:predicted transposase/invertase (TIGR01784 family)